LSADALDHGIIRDFWEHKSREQRNRWTSDEMLAYELGYLRELAPRPRSVLDLGSGHGELSRPLAGEARLLALDFAPAYARSFSAPNHEFMAGDVGAFDTEERFDVVLLFGVVTSIDEADEPPLYAKMAGLLAPGGVAVVKNQCALGEEFVATGYSEALGADYSGRYPLAERQRARLLEAFGTVELRPYPPQFNPWENSAHVAFVCREPRR
jgi:SAM-dependent methyltransferase